MNKIYQQFGIQELKTKSKDSMMANLHRVPIKDKGVNMPYYRNIGPNIAQQADLLFLPNDDGYRYALVVIDTSTKHLDAVPLKNKDATTVTEGFKTIYRRGLSDLKLPKTIEVDSGSEFKGSTSKYFLDNDVKIKVAPTGRHRSVAVVERANQTIGKILFKRMNAQELLTGQQSNHWVSDLPKLIKLLNEHVETRKPNKKLDKARNTDMPLCAGDSCNLLEKGDKVRVALEYPVNPVTGERLHGKFRATDIRWEEKPTTIRSVLITPNYPTLYLVEGSKVGYTKNQLSKVPENEKLPDPAKVLRGKTTQYIVNKLVDKKLIKNKVHYLVNWFGYMDKDNTWEPLTKLRLEVPEMIAQFEKSRQK